MNGTDKDIHKRTLDEWRELVERYFDALTDEMEEKQLRLFLTSPDAAGTEFDEARAVMGFLSVGKKKQAVRNPGRLQASWWKVAALWAGVVFGLGIWSLLNERSNICEAYIYGKKYTDEALVMAQVKQSIDNVAYGEEEQVVARQLEDMFNTMKDWKEE